MNEKNLFDETKNNFYAFFTDEKTRRKNILQFDLKRIHPRVLTRT